MQSRRRQPAAFHLFRAPTCPQAPTQACTTSTGGSGFQKVPIVNGLEVLDDNPKPEDRDFALDLIRKSARTASARLQFCRLAFGAAGSAGPAAGGRRAAGAPAPSGG